MHIAVKEHKTVDYDPVVRDYGIRFGKNMVDMLHFCPWCGSKLPKTLMREMFDTIEKEYGIPRLEADIDNYTNVPDEFKTDEWWRKRGL
jgi:hypothetical protein